MFDPSDTDGGRMLNVRRITLSLVLILGTLSQTASPWTHGQACTITKNIVTDFGAVGDGLTDDSGAFSSFQTWAVGTYLPSNPGATICLTEPAGDTFFFGSFVSVVFDGIPSLIVNGYGATMSNALNLPVSAGTSAGSNVLTFASVPASIKTGFSLIDLTSGAIAGGTTVTGVSPTTVTLSVNVTAPGVSIGDTISFVATGGYFLGTAGLTQTAASSAMVQAVSAGDTILTLQTVGQASLFTANTYALLTGIDMQGFGYPPNPFFWEYVYVTNVNATTGVVTIQSPTRFSYETTWPHYNFGDAFHINQGGPATLYPMPASWNAAHFYNGIRFYQWANGTLLNANGRSITFNNCTFVNWAMNLSQQMSMTANNCDLSNTQRLETDKLWQNATFNGGTIHGFFVQSAAANGTLTLNNATVATNVSGTPGFINVNNSTIGGALQIGAGIGQAQTASCANTTIASDVAISGNLDTSFANGGVTMSGGLITMPRSVEAPIPNAFPGADVFWVGRSTYGIPFSFTDLTADSTNTYVQSSLSGGFPSSLDRDVQSAPAKLINFIGCSGGPQVVDLSQPGARNARPFTYSNRIYTCTGNLASVQAANPGVPVIDMNSPPSNQPVMTRAIQSMTVNVSQADTSSNPAVNFHAMNEFDNYRTFSPSGTQTLWGAVINLKTAGTRSYNGTTSIWSGAQTGDTLPTVTSPSYMSGSMNPFTDVNLSGDAALTCPVVTVAIQTQ